LMRVSEKYERLASQSAQKAAKTEVWFFLNFLLILKIVKNKLLKKIVIENYYKLYNNYKL
jgi:hypothetical protein